MNISKIKQEGIYLFGGKTHSNHYPSQLYCLPCSPSPLKLIQLQTIGSAPFGRFLHTLSFIKPCSALVLIGGRNDNQLDNSQFSSIWILKLNNLEWIRMEAFGVGLSCYRVAHSIGVYQSRIIMLGGYNAIGQLVNMDLMTLEFDRKLVKEKHFQIEEKSGSKRKKYIHSNANSPLLPNLKKTSQSKSIKIKKMISPEMDYLGVLDDSVDEDGDYKKNQWELRSQSINALPSKPIQSLIFDNSDFKIKINKYSGLSFQPIPNFSNQKKLKVKQ